MQELRRSTSELHGQWSDREWHSNCVTIGWYLVLRMEVNHD